MRFIKILIIILMTWSLSASYAFSSEIKNCKPQLSKFSNFKSDLIDCFNEENKVIDNNIIAELTDKPSSFFSVNELKEKKFFSNNQLSINKNFEKYFRNIVQKNYQSLYGIQLELKSLETNKYISVKNYDEFIENSLEIFDSTISNNGSLNKNLGLAAAAALVVSALDLSSEDGKSITLSLSASSLQENSGTTLTITATASESVASDTTVNLSFSGDATSGTDYSVASSSITILSGSTTGTTTISLTDDGVYEGNESISISTSSITGDSEYTSSSPTASFTILENESAPVITMSAASSTITENSGSNIVLTFTSSQVSDEDITISLSTSGTSTAGTDYSSLSNVTISANSTSNTLNFTPTDDSIYEGDETAIISIDTVSGSDATESASQSVTITITENETAPTLTLTSSASSIAENSGSSLTLTATLSGATSEDVTVALAISGTATSGTDYSSLSNMTITSGQTTTTASFTPTDDNIYEGNETAIIDVDSVSGGSATESGTQQLTLTISDNESAPTVTLTSSASSVSEDGSAITLTATLSNATTADVTVTLSTGGTATEGTDYANLSDITVSAGDTTGTTSLTPTNDSTFEGDETITIDIDTVSGGSATENGTQQVSITFQEDDAGPTLTISDVTTSDESAANAQVTVTLSPASGLSATVDYTTSDGTATAGSDYTSTSGTLTFTAGQTSKTINVPILTDSTDENDETITLTLNNAVRATISDPTSTITITDDDSAPSLSINDVTTSDESNSASNMTVTLSVASGKDITVDYATFNGTATAGSDYTATSGALTISAGSTTGVIPITVLTDSLDEGNETLTLTLSNATNASISDGTGIFTITDNALSAGTTKTYNASLTSTIASSAEYTNIEALNPSSASEDSPYETINLAEALGYSDYGAGQKIAIVDRGYTVDGCVNGGLHDEFSGKTIAVYGTITCAGFIPTGYHGTSVASIAAGVKDGAGIMGVASQADLHISDYSTLDGETYYPDAWASATDDARADGAVVQNNSWGCDITLTAVQNYMTNNSVSASNATNVAFNSCSFTSNIAAVDNYVTALDDFQTAGGVIVYALSNNTSFSEADVSAALPELFTDLKEAWITAVNIDKTGSSGSYSYTLQSAPCGSTAEYCLGADGTNITVAANANNSDTDLYTNTTGTSFVAPQISGAVALLGNHFPNHTPEKLVDRLLASADNTWLTADGTVTFGNGVQHGYSDDYGHGLMDIYAALQPITTNSLGRSIYTTSSNNTDTSSAQSLDRTYLASSRSFGDSIKNAVDGKLINNFYDAMGMQFKYNVGEHIVVPESNTVPTIDLKNEMNKLVSADTLNNQLNLNNSSFDNIIKKDTLYEKEDFKSELAITLGSSSIPTQSFFNFDQYTFNGITDYNLPFLNKNDQGLSLNSIIELDNLKISFSTTTPMKQNDNEYLGNQKSLLSSLEYQFSDDLSVGLLNGLVNEKDNFLGLEGGEALSVNNSNNLSKFNSIKLQKNILEDMSLTVTGSYAISNFDGDQNSMISSADNIKSDSYSINFNKANLLKNDNFAFSISQPNRVYSGKMKFKLSDIVDYDGNIAVTEVPVDLKPSGRQLDTSASYAYDFSRDITLSAKVTYTNELNHIKDSEDVISSFIGLRHGNLKLGLSETDNFKDTNFMIDFKKQF